MGPGPDRAESIRTEHPGGLSEKVMPNRPLCTDDPAMEINQKRKENQ